LDAHPECAIVGHNLRVFDDETGETLYYFNEKYKRPMSTIDDLIMFGTFFGHPSKMFRRSALPEEGVDLRTKYVGDWLFHIQNARKGKIGYIDETLGEWRKSRNSFTWLNDRNRLNALRDEEYTLEKAAGYTSNVRAVKYGYARLYYSYAYKYFMDNNIEEFRHYIDKSAENRIFIHLLHYLFYRFRSFPLILRSFIGIKRTLKRN
jgi:hypothetical protein